MLFDPWTVFYDWITWWHIRSQIKKYSYCNETTAIGKSIVSNLNDGRFKSGDIGLEKFRKAWNFSLNEIDADGWI